MLNKNPYPFSFILFCNTTHQKSSLFLLQYNVVVVYLQSFLSSFSRFIDIPSRINDNDEKKKFFFFFLFFDECFEMNYGEE